MTAKEIEERKRHGVPAFAWSTPSKKTLTVVLIRPPFRCMLITSLLYKPRVIWMKSIVVMKHSNEWRPWLVEGLLVAAHNQQ